jgi:FdrA protein
MSTPATFRIFPNLYKDSVSLMQVAAKLREREGIEQASCIMATPANLAQLADADLAIDATVAPSDLLVVVRGDRAACEQAIDAAATMLKSSPAEGDGGTAVFSLPLTSIALALEQNPDADLALISVPGAYAGAEAMKALALGLNVMLFSDNVPIAEERALKTCARDQGLLVMGPDCGTAIVNGVPLGFANVVRRGDIGLVAASGTGLQEVTCRIHNRGYGVSQALGTGGRDLSEEIGGITMLQGLRALMDDSRTRVIVLISKPPSPEIARRILALAGQTGKPVVVHFLGAPPDEIRRAGLYAAATLQHAADMAVALAQGQTPPKGDAALSTAQLAGIERSAVAMSPTQNAIRGLFTGGTFCYEAQLAFLREGLPCASNAPVQGAKPLERGWRGHVFMDMGDDEFTRGRPHPMIDPSLRNATLRSHAADSATAAILFDVVLGYGAHANPTDELVPTLIASQRDASAQGRALALIGHVCGTDGDPQNKAAQAADLERAGVIVGESNFEAVSLAARLARRLAPL